MKKLLIPVIDGKWRIIGPNPDLGNIHQDGQECVDHHVFQTGDGMWHLWGCIRKTKIGRVLYHWQSDDINSSNWEKTGEMIRVDHNAGESIDDWFHEEWIQSPYVVQDNGSYYMFYGGHTTGFDEHEQPISFEVPTDVSCHSQSQMCLMTSKDGSRWTRWRDENNNSRVFFGPGEVRDPCLIKISDTWHMYYAGNILTDDNSMPGVFMRTSKDLIHWTDWKLVAHDPRFGLKRGFFECPHVVQREGYYYLFLTKDYARQETQVYRSSDPADFGIGLAAAQEKFVGKIAVAAPEIIVDRKGNEYITSNHNLKGGTSMCRLFWQEDNAAD